MDRFHTTSFSFFFLTLVRDYLVAYSVWLIVVYYIFIENDSNNYVPDRILVDVTILF